VGTKFTFPRAYFANVNIADTLAFLNDGAKSPFIPKRDLAATVVAEDARIPNKNGRENYNELKGESLGVYDIDEEYIPASKRRSIKAKAIDAYVDENDDNNNRKLGKKSDINSSMMYNNKKDDIPIVDVPINIRPIYNTEQQSTPFSGNGNNNYRTTTINGEKVIYFPMPTGDNESMSRMMEGMSPFGFGMPNITLSPQNITINPQTVTMNPQTVTMNPQTVTMNPEIVTMNPQTVTMNPQTVTMNPQTVTMNPQTVTMNPEIVTMNPQVVTMNPDVVTMNPQVVTMNPEIVTMNPESVNIKPESVSIKPETVNIISENINVAAESNIKEVEKENIVEDKNVKNIEKKQQVLSIKTRVVGVMRKDGVVFYDKEAENEAAQAGIKYKATIEPKVAIVEKLRLKEEEKRSEETFFANDNVATQEFKEDFNGRHLGDPEIIEFGPAPFEPEQENVNKNVVKESILNKISNFFTNILKFFGKAHKQNKQVLLAQSNSKEEDLSKKAKNNSIIAENKQGLLDKKISLTNDKVNVDKFILDNKEKNIEQTNAKVQVAGDVNLSKDEYNESIKLLNDEDTENNGQKIQVKISNETQVSNEKQINSMQNNKVDENKGQIKSKIKDADKLISVFEYLR
ncbi:MAG: hypothetical protein RR316_01575, partial [Clostridia bacterium]